MPDRVEQPFDLQTVCDLVADHLRRDGIQASARTLEVRVAPDLRFRLRREQDDAHGSVSSLFWVVVKSPAFAHEMQLDLSGWGLSAQDRITDAVHGLVECIVPAVRWLAAERADESLLPPRALRRLSAVGDAWTIVAGEPWAIVGLAGNRGEPGDASSSVDVATDGGEVDALARALRRGHDDLAIEALEPIGTLLSRLRQAPDRHWIKIYASRVGDATTGRIDVDSELSLDAQDYAASLPWYEGDAIQIVRQLIVLRPNDLPAGAGRRRLRLRFRR